MRSRLFPRRRHAGVVLVAVVLVATLWAGDARFAPLELPPPAPAGAAPAAATPAVAAPAPPALAPAVTIAGTIVDGEGAPIAGVRVSAGAAAAETDARGAFALAAPVAATHVLALDGPSVFPAEVTWRAGDPPPRILLARRTRFETRVLAAGAPVAGAEVHLSDGGRAVVAIAGADGVARFDELVPGPYEVWARHGSRVSALARVGDPAAARPELALADGGSVRGRVVADGRLAGGSVRLVPLDVDHAVRVAALDATGAFAIDGLPRGRWSVVAETAGYVQATEQVLDARGGTDALAIPLARTGAATGSVVDHEGAPVANATIVLRPHGAQALQERPLAPEQARLRWVHPLAGRRLLPQREFVRFGGPREGKRPAECGQGHCGVDLGWQKGTVIHAAADGRVALAVAEDRGEAGRFIAIDHGHGLRSYYIHLDELRPGLEVGTELRAGEAIGTMGATGAARGPHLHFGLTQQHEGKSWYIDPEPILRHAVVLAAPRPLDPIGARDTLVATLRGDDRARARGPLAITTDARGRFRATELPPGAYVAVAFAADLAPGTSAPFTVRGAAEASGVAITLRPGLLVEGRVLGRDGPLAGATIVASAGSGEDLQQVATTHTTGPGEYALRALSGTITLTASAPGHGTLERTIHLGAGRRHREDFVLVAEDAQLRGQVLAADGGAAGEVALRVVDGPTRRRVVTDAAGRFAIDRVAAGTYVLEASAPDHPATRLTVATDRFAELRLPRGGAVRGELRDAHTGAPLAGVRVEATGPDGRAASAVSDARGVVGLRALAAGEWTVRVRAKGYPAVTRAITVEPGTVPAELRLDLARGATLAGVVRDRYGRRVAGARVTFAGTTTSTDADGEFRITDAPAGHGWLEAELEGARGTTALELAPGDERLTLAVELAP